jgi:hypothetical protein
MKTDLALTAVLALVFLAGYVSGQSTAEHRMRRALSSADTTGWPPIPGPLPAMPPPPKPPPDTRQFARMEGLAEVRRE